MYGLAVYVKERLPSVQNLSLIYLPVPNLEKEEVSEKKWVPRETLRVPTMEIFQGGLICFLSKKTLKQYVVLWAQFKVLILSCFSQTN